MLFRYQKPFTNRQVEELAKFCMDIAKLSLGSWVLGLFTAKIGQSQFLLAFSGLTFAVLFFYTGIKVV